MRNRAYRRNVESLHLAKRKRIINIIKEWGLTDEQIKVGQDHAVNWMSNEWWADSYKKKCNRKRRHEFKRNIIKEKYE